MMPSTILRAQGSMLSLKEALILPNIVNFSKVSSLREMTDHIYGRSNLMHPTGRPHMFVKELELYIDFLEQHIARKQNPDKRMIKNWETYCNNLLEGIVFYREFLKKEVLDSNQEAFKKSLEVAELTVNNTKTTLFKKVI